MTPLSWMENGLLLNAFASLKCRSLLNASERVSYSKASTHYEIVMHAL